MLIKDKVVERLRQGTPFAEVRRGVSSVSQLYEGGRQYLDEAGEEISVRQERLEELRAANIEEENRRAELEVENAKLAKENMELTQKNMDLTQEVARKTEKSRHLDAAKNKLSAQGYSPEIIEKIMKIEERSGPQLLHQVETLEKFHNKKRELLKLKGEKKALQKEISDLKIGSTNLKDLVTYHRNMLDELEVRIAAYEAAVSAVEDLLAKEYSVEDIMSLKSGLEHVQIRGDPKTSIKRLVEGLIKMKKLHTLNEKIAVREKKLAALNRKLAETREESKILKETTINAIEDEKDVALKSIDNIGARANARLEGAVAKFEDTLKRGEDDIRGITEDCREGLGEYSSLQQEIGKLKEHISYGRALFEMLNSADYLMTIPPTVVAEILDRVALWSRSNYPELTVSPSPSVIQKENKLISIWKYNLAALIEFAAEGLRYQIPEPASGMPIA